MTLQESEKLISKPEPTAPSPVLSGQIIYMYAFDIAYDMRRLPIKQLLKQPVEQFVVDAAKHSPKQLLFYRPQMLRLPPLKRTGPCGLMCIELAVKLLPVGALSIRATVSFQNQRVEELTKFHDLVFADNSCLYDEVKKLAEQARQELLPYLVRPVQQLPEEEAYTVFCIHGPVRGLDGSKGAAEQWLSNNRRTLAALLTEERDPARLSDQEAAESTGKSLSYFEDDLVVIDWDAALIIDDSKGTEEILYIMELANVQLAELEAYDRLLDEAIERASRDLTAPRFFRSGTLAVQRELREMRIDLARLSDELSNITKFFGDWHLARVYQALASRFHLSDWHRAIDEKLKTLDDLYQIMRADKLNRWMLTLEVTVVILFIIELVNSFVHWSH